MVSEKFEKFELRVFDKESVSEVLAHQYFNFIYSIWKEIHPLEPLPSIDSMKQHFFEPIPNKESFSWIVFKEGEVAGSCDLLVESPESPLFEERKSTGQFWMNVSRKYRRKGLGTKMLKTIINETSKFDFVEFLELTGATPLEESIAFCENFGGEVTFEAEEIRIYIDKIDWKKIQQMKDEVYEEFSEVSLEVFEKIPERIIEEFAKAFSEIRFEKPLDEISVEESITSERVRNFETKLNEDKIKWISFLMRDSKKEIIAIGDLRYHLDALERVNEAFAGTRLDYQRTKIKNVLKAEMLLHIKENLPKVRIIYIWVEHPTMKDINKEIGFTKHYQGKHYKFNLTELKNRLK